MTRLADAGPGGRPGAPVVLVSGLAGMGKTALVPNWANEVRQRIPDGQLFTDLRGPGPACPIPAADALAGFLRTVGIPDAAMPASAAERSALYCSMLAGRKVLIVLDNASGAEQGFNPFLRCPRAIR